MTKSGISRRAVSVRPIGNPLSEARIGFYASGIVLAYAAALAVRLSRHQWIVDAAERPCIDFIWIWLSSRLAVVGALAGAYDPSLLSAARSLLIPLPNCLLEHLDYPPTFLLFTAPFGGLPYPVAFFSWIAATLIVYLAAVHAIVPRPAAVITALTPFPVFFNIVLGHNGFLTAGLMGLALSVMERRAWLGGALIGLLTCKPQLGILFPIALLASRQWRAFAAAAAAAVLLAVAAGLAFGWQAWPAFAAALIDRARSLSDAPNAAFAAALVSVFGTLRSVGIGAAIAWSAQFAVTAAVALTVGVLWARPIPYALQASALAVGSLLASPHAHGYDALLLTIGAAFLVKDGLERGFLPNERGAMLGCWAALFLLTGPMPAIVSIVLLALVLRRVWRLPWHESVAAHAPRGEALEAAP